MKKCPTCGHELAEGAAFCGNCGATVKAEQPVSTPSATPAKSGFGSKKFMKIGIAAVAVILIAALAITLLPSVFASPAKTFVNYQRKAFIDPILNAVSGMQEKSDSLKISTDLTISAEISGGDYIDEEVEDLLKNSSIVLKVDADKESALLNADLIIDEEAIFSAIFNYAKGKIGLSFPEIDDSTYVLNIDEFIKENADTETSVSSIIGSANIDTKELAKILEKYIDILFTAVTKDSVEVEKDEKIRLDMLGEKLEGTVYTWTPDGDAIEEMLGNLAKELEDDKQLREFIMNTMNEDVLSALSLSTGEEIDASDLEEMIEDFIEVMVEGIEESAEYIAEEIEEADIKWIMALEGKVIRLIQINVGDEGTIAFENFGKDSEGVEQVFYVSTYDEPEFIIRHEYEVDGSEKDGKISYNDGWDDFEFSYTIDTKKTSVLGFNYGEYKVSGSMIDDLTIKFEVEEAKGGADHILTLRDMYYYTDGAFDKLSITVNATEKGSAEDHSGKEEDITEYDEEELYDLIEELGEKIYDDLEGVAFGKGKVVEADTAPAARPAN